MPDERVWKNFRPRVQEHFLPDTVKTPLLPNKLIFSEDVIAWIHICPESLTPNFKWLNKFR